MRRSVASLPLPSPFHSRTMRNPHRNSHLRRGQGRALHLSRFRPNSLIYLILQIYDRASTVTTLPQKRCISVSKPLQLFRLSVASLRNNGIYACQFNPLRDPPVSSPVVTYKSFFEELAAKREKTRDAAASQTTQRLSQVPHLN
jgi:hypothetical protein